MGGLWEHLELHSNLTIKSKCHFLSLTFWSKRQLGFFHALEVLLNLINLYIKIDTFALLMIDKGRFSASGIGHKDVYMQI